MYPRGMKLLTFQASRFGWKAFSQTLDDAPELDHPEGQVGESVVAFFHIEACDEPPERRKKVFKKTIVLHSFTHLGGQNASPEFALEFLREMSERLANTGYEAPITPFGWFSSWDIDVYGDSLAKVFKEI